MKRLAMDKLLRWKAARDRKPLIIRGVRQVGKTWLMTVFGDKYFPNNTNYFNFDLDPDLSTVFASSQSPATILEALAFKSGKPIRENSLIIFDEAQSCPASIHALKYFCEMRPDLRVLLAGSLLGLNLTQPASFPVGKVDFMTLEPFSFREFLSAQNETGLVDLLSNWDKFEEIPDLFFKPLTDKFRHYELVGGMPEPVSAWCFEQDLQAVAITQTRILEAYLADIRSHAASLEVPKILRIWQSLPRQLSRENKQFRYSTVEERSNARKYGDALQWLIDARIARSVHRIKGMGIPLAGYEEPGAFKIYFVDTGLLARLTGITSHMLLEDNLLFKEIKGALAENLVLQSLSRQLERAPHYWAKNNPPAEVDFLIEYQGRIIPIEVKASTNTKSYSLKKFKELYGGICPLRVRFSMRNLSLDGDVLNIPLFMADEALRLIDLALEKIS